MAAAVQTLGADSRVRIEENVRLRLLAQRLGATPKELEAVRRSSIHGAARGSGDGERSVGVGGGTARVVTATAPILAAAWMPPAATLREDAASLFPDDAGGGGNDGGAAAADGGVGNDRGSGAGGSPLGAAWRAGALSTSADASAASPVEALQSQIALQEKLRKVRATFAGIRRQVGHVD